MSGSIAFGQSADPAYPLLERAYAALETRNYDDALDCFRQALGHSPGNAAARKDLAYTLLKVGENEAARDEFKHVYELAPGDHQVALEYAFLSHETGRTGEARRVFDQMRKKGDPKTRATAEQAFENIDRPLAEGIERWKSVVDESPNNFSAQRELARLAEERSEWKLAAKHYELAWRLRPDQRSLLLDLGRAWRELGKVEKSRAALLAASRGAEPRTAEAARALMPERYPYVSEFEVALEVDPDNGALRRELAYLLLALKRPKEAEGQFAILVEKSPDDLLSAAQLGLLRYEREDYQGAMPLLRRVLESDDLELKERVQQTIGLAGPGIRDAQIAEAPVLSAKELGKKSLEAGYLQDAKRQLDTAHRADPADFEVMLNLAKTHNVLKQDEQAIQWFDLASRSPDPEVAEEAAQAYKNLRPSYSRFRHTFWVMPFYSSRWNDVFAYAQFKTEVRFRKVPLRPYISVRFAGDARRTIGSVAPQYLSESSFVFGIGVRTVSWKGVMAWAEAGSDVSYLDRDNRDGRMAPDYRGGVSFGKSFGSPLGGEAAGAFFETYENGVFMSRFNNTFLGYSQNRLGYTPPVLTTLGGLETQLFCNGNLTADAKQQDWANFIDFGPGVRFRWSGMPKSMVFSVDFLHGVYLLKNNPRGANYNDIRAGVWYAFSK
jgi:tetratricopeptide (TPR) repeat protein